MLLRLARALFPVPQLLLASCDCLKQLRLLGDLPTMQEYVEELMKAQRAYLLGYGVLLLTWLALNS